MTQWMKAELLHNERWEGEAGATMAVEMPLITGTGRFVRPLLKTAGLQNIPRQWNGNFIIESIRPGMAFGSSKRDAQGGD